MRALAHLAASALAFTFSPAAGHTKSQRIGGQAALSLPDTDQTIVWLDMTNDESLIYNLHGCKDNKLNLDAHSLAKKLNNRRRACAHLYSSDHTVTVGLELGTCRVAVRAAADPASRFPAQVHGKDEYRDATEEETANKVAGLEDWHHPPRIIERYSLDKPKPDGDFPAATAAFLRLHEHRKVEVKLTKSAQRYSVQAPDAEVQTHTIEERWLPKPHLLTKYKALLSDLEALREEDTNMRVVIFTVRLEPCLRICARSTALLLTC